MLGLGLSLGRMNKSGVSVSAFLALLGLSEFTAVADFTNAKYILNSQWVDEATWCSGLVRSTIKIVVNSSGALEDIAINRPAFDWSDGTRKLLIEGSATNLYLNSDTFVTQSNTVTAQSYTVSFYGTGTITFSGAYTGSLVGTGANNRVTLTFTATAGSLTSTVSGSVTSAQLETGTFASSYIRSGASAATRAADVFTAHSTVLSMLANTQGTSLISGKLRDGTAANRALIALSNTSRLMRTSSANANRLFGDTSSTALTKDRSPLVNFANSFKGARTWDDASPSSSMTIDNQVPATNTFTSGTRTTLVIGGLPDGTLSANGAFGLVAFAPTALSSARLQAITA